MQCALNGQSLISLIIPGVRYFGPIGGAVEGEGCQAAWSGQSRDLCHSRLQFLLSPLVPGPRP